MAKLQLKTDKINPRAILFLTNLTLKGGCMWSRDMRDQAGEVMTAEPLPTRHIAGGGHTKGQELIPPLPPWVAFS